MPLQSEALLGEELDVKFAELNKAITTKYDKRCKELSDENEQIRNENKVIKMTILEQQKFLEFIGKDRTKNNIFISGVPNEMTTEGDVENNDGNILQSVLNVTTPGIDTTTYRIVKN